MCRRKARKDRTSWNFDEKCISRTMEQSVILSGTCEMKLEFSHKQAIRDLHRDSSKEVRGKRLPLEWILKGEKRQTILSRMFMVSKKCPDKWHQHYLRPC